MCGSEKNNDAEAATANKILLIDDHALFRDVLSDYLTNNGFDVTTATGLQDAVSKVQASDSFDLVLLDYHLRGTTPFSNIVSINRFAPKARIAIVTASESPIVGLNAKAMGAVGFIKKSIRPQKFLSVLSRMINGEKYFPDPALEKQLIRQRP